MAIRLVLVRHGLSSFNAKGLIQGRTDDSLLTDEGYEQAIKAGKALSKISFDKIYEVIHRTFDNNSMSKDVSIESIYEADTQTRIKAKKVVKSIT